MDVLLQTPFIPENFSYIANRLINYTLLMVKGHPHRICEVEFYLNSTDHPDQYVHSDLDQTKRGTWYFHRKGGTYKEGNFRGMDIVFGTEGICAAVLIRSIFDIDNRIFIEGPCLTVNHILAFYGAKKIIDFTKNQSLSVLDNSQGLILQTGNIDIPDPLYRGPRFGLSDKYPERFEYKDKPYRYALHIVKKQKTKLKLVN